MRSPTLHTGPELPAPALAELRRRVAGRLRPRDDAAPGPVAGPPTGPTPHRPPAVLEVADVEDVSTAVRWAVTNSVQVGSGSVGEGGAAPSGALLLDLTLLDDVRVDLGRQVAHVGAGVSVGDLTKRLAGSGHIFLGAPGGRRSVSAATLTGGLGWFGRAFGLACDSVVGAEVVDGLGRVRSVGAECDPDLHWALRGGGAGYGVVVGLDVALHPAPRLHAGRLCWPVDAAAAVLDAFRRTCALAPDRLTAWFEVLPSRRVVGAAGPGGRERVVSVVITCLDGGREARDLVRPLLQVPGLIGDTLGAAAPETAISFPSTLPPEPGWAPHVCSTVVQRLDDDLVADLAAAVRDTHPEAGSTVQVRQLGGAFRRSSSGSGCHGPVAESFVVRADPPLVRPGRRTLPDLRGPDEPDTWFDAATRERLAVVKQAVDPVDTICGRPAVD